MAGKVLKSVTRHIFGMIYRQGAAHETLYSTRHRKATKE